MINYYSESHKKEKNTFTVLYCIHKKKFHVLVDPYSSNPYCSEINSTEFENWQNTYLDSYSTLLVVRREKSIISNAVEEKRGMERKICVI